MRNNKIINFIKAIFGIEQKPDKCTDSGPTFSGSESIESVDDIPEINVTPLDIPPTLELPQDEKRTIEVAHVTLDEAYGEIEGTEVEENLKPQSHQEDNVERESDTTDIKARVIGSSMQPDERYENLLSLICNTINELDEKRDSLAQMPTDKMLNYVRKKVISAIMRSGATIIQDGKCFDILKHKPVEITDIPEEGAPISELLLSGVEYCDKVYLRATVKLECCR